MTPVAPAFAESSAATELGLWLAAIGAIVVVCATFSALPSRGEGGLTFGSPEGARPERVQHAVQSVALAFIAVGGVIVAVAELPPIWVALTSLAVFAAGVWLAGAFTQHRVWLTQRESARRAIQSSEASVYPLQRWKLQCAEHCARWSWALCHPFNGQSWPDDFKRRQPPPGDE